jgi:hypothetical protein
MSCASLAKDRPSPPFAAALLSIILFDCRAAAALASPANCQERLDPLVARLRALAGIENAFGPADQPLYPAALPWQER